MTLDQINRIKSHLKKDDVFSVITGSQMVITNTKTTPIIFDDAKQLLYCFERCVKGDRHCYKDHKYTVNIIPYDAIESIDLINSLDDTIGIATELGITGDDLQRVKDAFKRDHGDYINNHENVIK